MADEAEFRHHISKLLVGLHKREPEAMGTMLALQIQKRTKTHRIAAFV